MSMIQIKLTIRLKLLSINKNAMVSYPNIKNLADKKSITFYLSSQKCGTIEIREKDAKGKLLGKCKTPKTGDWKTYQEVSCDLNNVSNVTDICLVFKGNKRDSVHLDWFKFGTVSTKN
jgi:hypothetical protein